tara:strand:+ start:348 stop:770 length:423 start_codon:yes stop_codon:yes gene_type:complete
MLDKKIVEFINQHHLLTLATSKDNIPYCCNAFYVFNKENISLIFSSDTSSKHAQDFIKNPIIAASIALETKAVGKIQGVQLLGEIIKLKKGKGLEKASKQYFKAYPYARLIDTCLWEMSLNFVKMTHNRLGFGKKLIWEK